MYALLLITIALRFSYWIALFSKLALSRGLKSIEKPTNSVSVVICVKNNLAGIKKSMPRLGKQNYDNYEIVIVDDHSTDELEAYIQGLNNPKIRYLRSEGHGKKAALTSGVKFAKYPWILVTDSDCLPASLDWIKHMSGGVTGHEIKIVLGYGPLNAGSSLASQLAAYEAAYIGMQYLSYAASHIPYMGVGRNMLFEKQCFLEAGLFCGDDILISGDDDLFIQKAATSQNTNICLHPNSFCASEAPGSFSTWFTQKTRQISTADKYQPNHKLLLAIFAALHLLVYGLLFLNLFFNWFTFKEALAAWLMMIALISVVQFPVFRKLNALRTMMLTPGADLFLAVFYMVASPYLFILNNTKWK
ncbi:MAG: glycosyltransferase [Saprospiraceae bacterium]|nr:glycosyltransferase [Saprospiraceae bacterium]